MDITNARYKIQFIFGEAEAYIRDKSMSRSLTIRLDAPATEETFQEEFEHLVEALKQSGNARDGDVISCMTFPAGTKRFFVKGHA